MPVFFKYFKTVQTAMTLFPNRQRIVLERHRLGLALVHISKTNFYQKVVKVINLYLPWWPGKENFFGKCRS